MRNPFFICSGCGCRRRYLGFIWAIVTVPVLDREGNQVTNRDKSPRTTEKQGCVCPFCGEQAHPAPPEQLCFDCAIGICVGHVDLTT
jgi:hypothetical protein